MDLLSDFIPWNVNDTIDNSLMYNKHSVVIKPTYFGFSACLRRQTSCCQSPAVVSERLKILGKVTGGCILPTQQEWAFVALWMQEYNDLLFPNL
jgi:hypothetical protein